MARASFFRLQGMRVFTPPGEDSAAFLVMQSINPEVVSTQIDWLVRNGVVRHFWLNQFMVQKCAMPAT